jgi:predicted metalloprotease
VLFRGQTNSGCGPASSATGPFYCPLDQRVYIDLGFFDELSNRFQAPGDFAQAYVLAHEIGHHVQQELGIEQKVRQESQSNPDEQNPLSVRLELQADCLAGVWARSTYDRGILESGDLQEGLRAAAAVGDDRIQSQTQGRINPETFTHGTSEQRSHWLQTGFDSGKLESCDTFSGDI